MHKEKKKKKELLWILIGIFAANKNRISHLWVIVWLWYYFYKLLIMAAIVNLPMSFRPKLQIISDRTMIISPQENQSMVPASSSWLFPKKELFVLFDCVFILYHHRFLWRAFHLNKDFPIHTHKHKEREREGNREFQNREREREEKKREREIHTHKSNEYQFLE